VKADYFPRTGDFSFAVSAMRHVGLGEQLERLERLRAQLRSEGLFDPARKKKLPFLPHCIGLITGENSDAEKDVHRNAELRWPQVRFRTR
ncbi:exodeoxyribonuclease VII large subunit, partial [Acinetobacter baumannii]